MAINTATIIGNLARDVNLHEGENTSYCNMTVAVNDRFGDKEEVDFISVKAFGKTAENCARYLSKGSKVAVNGKIKTGSYEKQDGTKVYTTDIYAYQVEFLSKASDRDEVPGSDSDVDRPKGFNDVDEDIPF